MTQRRRRNGWLATGVTLLGTIAGCHDHVDTVRHRDPVDMPAPTGTFVHEFEAVQASKARASHFVFFLDEWYMGGTILGPHGSRHFQHLIAELPKSHAVITIQPSSDPELNEKRRIALVSALLRTGVADAEARVIVAFPMAEGLDGEETERIYRQMLTPAFNNLGLGLGIGLPSGNQFGGGLGGANGGGLGGFGGYGAFGGGPFGGGYGTFGRTNGYLP